MTRRVRHGERVPGVPGLRFDARAKRAYLEVILSGGVTRGSLRRRATVGAGSLSEAVDRMREFRASLLAEERREIGAASTRAAEVSRVASQPLTLQSYVDRYFEGKRDTVREKTWLSYEWIVRTKLLPRFGATPLEEISLPSIREFVGALKKRELSACTVNRCVACLRMLLRDAHERGVLEALPYHGHLPHEREPELRLELSEDERERFLRTFDDEAGFIGGRESSRKLGPIRTSATGPWRSPRRFGGGLRPSGDAARLLFERFRRAKPLFVVALETGLRRSDLLELRWESVNFLAGVLRLVVRKTARPIVVPLSAACREALLECRGRRVVSEFIFIRDDGRPLAWESVRRHFALAKKLAGINRRLRFHDLRHTFASRVASAGVSLQKVAACLGHSTIRLSERYARVSEESLREVAMALDGPRVGKGGAGIAES